jgi:hypothetical protein
LHGKILYILEYFNEGCLFRQENDKPMETADQLLNSQSSLIARANYLSKIIHDKMVLK